jgi:hypothetical protein
MLLTMVFTAGSITQTFAPIFITVEDDLCRIPANIDVIMTIKKTAKVIPTINAANFPLSFTSSLYAILRIPFTVTLSFAYTTGSDASQFEWSCATAPFLSILFPD